MSNPDRAAPSESEPSDGTPVHNAKGRTDGKGVLPSFLIIGAQRAGTSLLHSVLSDHPEVYVPYQRKEIHYFDWYFGRGVDWYLSFFPPVSQAQRYRAIGEVTPDYLAAPGAAERISALLPDCRLVVILRNPVDRAYSWYLYSRRNHNEGRSFEEFIAQDSTTLEWGLYARHLERYLALFPRSAMCVLIYEELIGHPAEGFDRLARFLGLSTSWPEAQALISDPVNTSRAPRFRASFGAARRVGSLFMRHDLNWPVRMAKRLGVRRLFGTGAPSPEMSPALRGRLGAYYQADVRRLESLLARDLEIWTGSAEWRPDR